MILRRAVRLDVPVANGIVNFRQWVKSRPFNSCIAGGFMRRLRDGPECGDVDRIGLSFHGETIMRLGEILEQMASGAQRPLPTDVMFALRAAMFAVTVFGAFRLPGNAGDKSLLVAHYDSASTRKASGNWS